MTGSMLAYFWLTLVCCDKSTYARILQGFFWKTLREIVAFALLCDSRFWLDQSFFAHWANTESINTHTAQTITFCSNLIFLKVKSYLFSRRWDARITGNLHWSARPKRKLTCSLQCKKHKLLLPKVLFSDNFFFAKLLTWIVSLRWPAIECLDFLVFGTWTGNVLIKQKLICKAITKLQRSRMI